MHRKPKLEGVPSAAAMSVARCAMAVTEGHSEVSKSDDDDHVLLLPTRPSWRYLSGPMKEAFEEAISFLDEESAREMCARERGGLDAGGSADARPTVGGQHVASRGMPLAPPPLSLKRPSLDPASVIRIFLAKRLNAGTRSDLSGRLGRQHNITAKAIRDIWNMRTWRKTTQPFWDAADWRAAQARTQKAY